LKRKFFFYFLAVVFLFLGPVVVAYSFGYRLDFKTGLIEKTGGIFLKSNVSNASVFLNGLFEKETSFISGGVLLPEIYPGTYLVRIEKGGFSPWSKPVQVEPELVTEIRNILLIPEPLISATSTKEEIALISQKPPLPILTLDKKHNLTQRNATSSAIIATDIDSFGVIDSTIYFINRNGFLAQTTLGSGAIDSIGRPGFYLSGKASFVKSPLGEVAIIDGSGGLFLLSPEREIKPLDGGVKKVAFDIEGEKMLLLKDRSLELMWTQDNRYQPFQKKGTKELLVTFPKPIEDAHWFFDDEAHVVYRTKDGVYIAEIDGRGGKNIFELIPERVEEIATSVDFPNTIFYAIKSAWYKIQL